MDVFGFHGKERRKTIKGCFTARRSGFFSVMMLMCMQLLVLTLSFAYHDGTQLLQYRLAENKKQKIEWYLIHYIKHALAEYEEEDESITVEGEEVMLHYDDITAYASFQINGKLLCFRLQYDDLSDCVMDVSYIEDGCPY